MKHQWQWMKKRMRQVVAPWWWHFCHVFVNIFPISGPHDTQVHPKAFFRSLYSWDQAGGQRTIWVQATHLKSPILRSDGKLLLFFKITRVCYPLNHKGKDIALMCFFGFFLKKFSRSHENNFGCCCMWRSTNCACSLLSAQHSSQLPQFSHVMLSRSEHLPNSGLYVF